MRVKSYFAIALGSVVASGYGVITVNAQSSTPLDQINVEVGQQDVSSKNDGTILENPAIGTPSVTLSKEDLDLIHPTDLQDVFKNETSVSVGGSTPVTQRIYVNGIEDSRLAVTIDGAVQANSTFHHAGSVLLDPSLLKAVRVDPGVAPADAGPGALGGSIQFETVDVKDLLATGKTMGGFVVSSYDTNSETFSLGVSAYTKSNGFEALGFYKLTEGSDWDDGDGVEQDATAADLKTALGKIAYEAQSGDRLEFSYEWVNDDGIRPFRANFAMVSSPVIFPNQPYDMQRKNFVFNYSDEKPQGIWDPRLVIAFSETRLETYPAAPTPGGLSDNAFADIETWSGKFENKFAISNGSIVAGVDFFDITSEGGLFVSRAGTEKDRNLGVYAQARLTPIKDARLSFGSRIDHQEFEGVDGSKLDDTGFSGNVSGEYDLNEILTLKAGYAHVFGRIPLSEALLNHNSYGYDGVKTFDSDNFTAGVSAEYEGFSFDVSYSSVQIDDAIAVVPGSPFSRNFTADIETKSFDVAVGYKWQSGYFRAKYSNIDVTLDDDVISTTAFYVGTNIGELISLSAVHEFQDTGVTIGADVQIALQQDDVIPGAEPLPSYKVVNAFVQYVPQILPNITLRAEVNNIFDETYSDRATLGFDNSRVTTLKEPGRSLFLSARAEF